MSTHKVVVIGSGKWVRHSIRLAVQLRDRVAARSPQEGAVSA